MGGGAMRAAGKVAGITVANCGLRGVTSEHCPVFCATLRAASSRHEASLPEDVKLLASPTQAGVEVTSSEMDDWVLAGGEAEPVVSAVDRMPRVVFDGRPTLQEAKEATSELTVALEKVYLSSPHSAGSEVSFAESHYPCLFTSSSQLIENKASETALAPTVPAHAIKAFRFLYGSPAAQDVVASIACDQNVWNAVLHNPELQEFLQSQRAGLAYSNMNQSSAKRVDVAYEHAESQPDNGFTDVVQKVKTTVVDMISSLSSYFQSFFGGQGASRTFAYSSGTASAETVMGASFMGLAVMAIMVILLKRV
ncbi:hypothetical protein Salat_0321100 [Sesamum alatum]|uniref:Uncharacterized protein n=1 Tax=Sesamum alatum TaxID=300844 RepID=A0AAE2CZ07_9LAMI|nr:hypothetical protein Salat_0321100 [Sesamum alatum]